MAKPGPKPKPTVLKLAAGNPGRRPLNEREPQPTPGIPDAPAWLDDVARACWMRTAGELHRPPSPPPPYANSIPHGSRPATLGLRASTPHEDSLPLSV